MTSQTNNDSTPDMNRVLGTEDTCSDRLQPMWTAIDEFPAYPLPTADVVRLLREGGGFDVNAPLLEGWCRKGMVGDVSTPKGQFAWAAQNILAAAVQADTWRRWIPMDGRHVHKQSAVELAEAMASGEGTTVFTDLDTFDINACIEVLHRCEDFHLRHNFAVALKTKLRQLGVLDA